MQVAPTLEAAAPTVSWSSYWPGSLHNPHNTHITILCISHTCCSFQFAEILA